MGKRSNFKRKDRDFYRTPMAAVKPLMFHLNSNLTFTEPCAGDYTLASHLESDGHACDQAFDIHPMDPEVKLGDALETFKSDLIITNPPWDRKVLHPMIENFRTIAPAWLLFDSDWMHTKQSSDYMEYCSRVISVGRVKWFEGTTGKDNSCWYKFEQFKCRTILTGR